VYLYILCPHVTYSSTTHNTHIYAPGGIRTSDPSNLQTAYVRFRPRGCRSRRIRYVRP
jgi:hypothetical protein